MNTKSRLAAKLLDSIQEGDNIALDVSDLRSVLSRHAAVLHPEVLHRVAGLKTVTDRFWNPVTSEELHETIDCDSLAAMATAELDLRSRGGTAEHAQERAREERRHRVLRQAGGSEPIVVQDLIHALSDDDLDVAVAAARVLSGHPSPAALEPLMKASQSREALLREAAALALGAFCDRRAAAALRRLLRDPADAVGAQAERSIERRRLAGAADEPPAPSGDRTSPPAVPEPPRAARSPDDHRFRLFDLPTLGGPEVDDAALARYCAGHELPGLCLVEARVTDDGLACLARIRGLRHVVLMRVPIGDRALGHLRAVSSLETLWLEGTRVSAEGLAALRGHGLARLILCGGLSDAVGVAVGGLTTLRELSLCGQGLGDAGVAGLTALRSLESLSLRGTGITDAGLAALGGLSSLRSLDLCESAGISDAGLAAIRLLGALTALSLEGCPVGDRGLALLQGHRTLERLDLRRTSVTRQITDMAPLPALRDLDLRGSGVGSEDREAVTGAFPGCAVQFSDDPESDYLV